MRTALFIAIPLLLVMAWTWPLCISIFKRRRASMVYPHASIQQLLDLGANPPRAGVTMKQAAARYSTTTDGVFVHTRIELTPEGRRAASVTSGVLALLLSLTACAAKPAPAPLPTFPPVIQEEPFTPPRLKQRQYEVSDIALHGIPHFPYHENRGNQESAQSQYITSDALPVKSPGNVAGLMSYPTTQRGEA